MRQDNLLNIFLAFLGLTALGCYGIFHVADGLLPVYSFALGDGNPLWQIADYALSSTLVLTLSFTVVLFFIHRRARNWIALGSVPFFALVLAVAHYNFRGGSYAHSFEWTWIVLTAPALFALAFLPKPETKTI
jgi:hypothetical protein